MKGESGFPAHCTMPEQRQQHCADYETHEGIHLDVDHKQHILSSMWGKFSQNINKTEIKEFTRAQEFHKFLSGEKYDVQYVSPLTVDRVDVHYKMEGHMENLLPNVNIFIACFTTCWARLRLYKALNLLQERVLYFDTDSIIFF